MTAVAARRRTTWGPAPQPAVRWVERLMGMPVSVALRGPATTDAAALAAARSAWEAVVAELAVVDSTFSTWRPESWVSRLEHGEVDLEHLPVGVREEVEEVLALGAEAAEASGGAFSVHRCVGGRITFDPTGVVKGWAVERATRHLDGLDADWCLSAGGDLQARVRDPFGAPWRVGVEDPADPQRVVAVVPVHAGAVATSGAARRGDHVRDARTGLAPRGTASVTVVGRSLARADVEATCALLQGPDAAAWLEHRGLTGVVVADDGAARVVGGALGGGARWDSGRAPDPARTPRADPEPGGPVPRTPVTTSVTRTVDRGVEEVWGALVEHERMATWGPGMTVTLDREGEHERNGVGAVRRIKAPGPAPAIVEAITACEAPDRLGYRALSGVPFADYSGEVRLASRGARTEVTWSLTARPRTPVDRYGLKGVNLGLMALFLRSLKA